MKLFVMACFGTFIAFMVLEFLSGLFSSISKRKNEGKKGENEREQEE